MVRKLRLAYTEFSMVVDENLEAPDLECTICGRPLGYSSDDQPDWPTGPMCGDCYQAREMDNEIWADELAHDSEVDES